MPHPLFERPGHEAISATSSRTKTVSAAASTHPKYYPIWTSAAIISPYLAYSVPKGHSNYATHMQRASRIQSAVERPDSSWGSKKVHSLFVLRTSPVNLVPLASQLSFQQSRLRSQVKYPVKKSHYDPTGSRLGGAYILLTMTLFWPRRTHHSPLALDTHLSQCPTMA